MRVEYSPLVSFVEQVRNHSGSVAKENVEELLIVKHVDYAAAFANAVHREHWGANIYGLNSSLR